MTNAENPISPLQSLAMLCCIHSPNPTFLKKEEFFVLQRFKINVITFVIIILQFCECQCHIMAQASISLKRIYVVNFNKNLLRSSVKFWMKLHFGQSWALIWCTFISCKNSWKVNFWSESSFCIFQRGKRYLSVGPLPLWIELMNH